MLSQRPLHDIAASTVTLARSWLSTLDRKALTTPVPTETLVLWLETIIGQAPASELEGSARTAVMGRVAAIHDAVTARDEDAARR